jgi:hypothetical protein
VCATECRQEKTWRSRAVAHRSSFSSVTRSAVRSICPQKGQTEHAFHLLSPATRSELSDYILAPFLAFIPLPDGARRIPRPSRNNGGQSFPPHERFRSPEISRNFFTWIEKPVTPEVDNVDMPSEKAERTRGVAAVPAAPSEPLNNLSARCGRQPARVTI